MSEWPDEDTRYRVIEVAGALLGEVPPDLRAVAVSGYSDLVLIRMILAVGPSTDDRRDQLQDLAWSVEALAGSSLNASASTEESDGPLELRTGETWAFMRREPYV